MSTRRNVLVIINSLHPPLVDVGGMKIIYKYIKHLSREYNIHVITTAFSNCNFNGENWININQQSGIKLDIVSNQMFVNNSLISQSILNIKLYTKSFNIMRKNNIDIIHQYSGLTVLSVFSVFFKKIFDVPVVFTVSTNNDSFFGKINFAFGIHSVDYFTLSSIKMYKDACDKWPKYTNKINYSPFGVLPKNNEDNGSRTAQLTYDKFSKYKSDYIYSYIGPIEERKGAFLLVEAYKLLKKLNSRLFIFTYGENGVDYLHNKHLDYLYKLIGEDDSCHVFEGRCNVDKVFELTDCFVFPSITLHGTLGQPLTLLESLSSNCLTIASDLDENLNIISDMNSPVYIFNNNDKYSLLKALEDVRNDHNEMNLKEKVHNSYLVSETANSFAKNVYEKLL